MIRLNSVNLKYEASHDEGGGEAEGGGGGGTGADVHFVSDAAASSFPLDSLSRRRIAPSPLICIRKEAWGAVGTAVHRAIGATPFKLTSCSGR